MDVIDAILRVPTRWSRLQRRGIALWHVLHAALTIGLIVAVLLVIKRCNTLERMVDELEAAYKSLLQAEQVE